MPYLSVWFIFIVVILDIVYRFSAEDAQRDGFEYTVGICVPALRDISDTADVKLKTAGAIQVQKKTPGSVFDSRTHVIGDIEKTEIMSGSELFCSLLSEYFAANPASHLYLP